MATMRIRERDKKKGSAKGIAVRGTTKGNVQPKKPVKKG